jgi:endonuclease
MSIYDKPVRLLMKDMVSDLSNREGQIITREQVSSWFESNYPKIKPSTVSAHLLKMSTNAPSRIHYNVNPNGDDDLFYQIDSKRFRLFDAQNDPTPVYENNDDGIDPNGGEIPELVQPTEFAYERDLKNFLSKNLHLIAPGLQLYEDEEGITGIEFPVGGRFIDILAVDKQNNYVVIELKVSRGYDRVIGQLLRYMAWIEQKQAEPGQDVSGIIVAREISEDLLLAASKVSGIKLFEYQLSVNLRKIH